MADIIKVYQESIPSVRFIGKKYLDKDRDEYNSFGSKWGLWHANHWFEPLEKLALQETEGDAYLGLMRCVEEFEYWIGLFTPANTPVPEGYQYVDIPAGILATCWIYGTDHNGEIYCMHDQCMEEIQKRGWKLVKDPWFFERYQCPRFTTKDEKGNVILDYCAYIVKE